MTRRTAWLQSPDAGQEPFGTLTSTNTEDQHQMYVFNSATKYADNFGGGDWVIERCLGSFGIGMTQAGGARQMLKVCVGVGIGQGPTDVTLSTDITDLGSPSLEGDPELSWLFQLCCYIDTSSITVDRCEFDVKGRRRIGQHSRIWAVVTATTVSPLATNDVAYFLDFRMLLKGPPG